MRKRGRFAVIGIAALVLIGLGASGTSQRAEASETTVTLSWGKYTVPGFSEPAVLYVQCASAPCTNGGPYPPCYNCYITSLTPELEVDIDPTAGENWVVANYTSVVPARLHHMVLFNHAQIDPTCAGDQVFSNLGDRWFASGDERGTLSFPAGYGYYIPPAYLPSPPNPPNTPDPTNYWITQVMIHNLSSQSHDFRLQMTFKYAPASDNLKSVRHLWLDQFNCGNSSYPVPAGYRDDHWDWTVGEAPGTADDIEGKIFEMGGHVHDFGTSVAGTLMPLGSSTETLICASRGGYAAGSTFAPDHIATPNSPAPAHPADPMVVGSPDPGYLGHIEAMSGCVTNTMIKPGDMIHLHTQYVADAPIPDVMGIMGAWVYDNCPNASNPTQEDILDGGDDYGDACDADADGDGVCNTGAQGPGGYSCSGTDGDDDADGYADSAESGSPLCGNGINDDGVSPVFDDAVVDDGCPGGPTATGTYSEGQFKIGTGGLARCEAGSTLQPSVSWPSDFVSAGVPNSTDKINILDLTSFLAPTRRLDSSPGSLNFSARWDLTPGKGVFGTWIAINDLTALFAGSTGSPPMFGGGKAFNGPLCTGS